MLIAAFACFLALLLAWLLVPTSGRAEVQQPAATTFVTEAAGD